MVKLGVFVLLALGYLTSAGEALACRVETQPTALASLYADAIVLVKITNAQQGSEPLRRWAANAEVQGTVWGKVDRENFHFGEYLGSCWRFEIPKLDRYWVLYLNSSPSGLIVGRAAPFWWARQSSDSRLERLNALLPLGAARQPTPHEKVIMNLAEARIRLQAGARNLANFSLVYAHSSANMLRVAIIPSIKPERLFVDSVEEWPTPSSCKCEIVEQHINVEDLSSAGKIPPFDP